MNADHFYEEFKQALAYMDVPWGEKHRLDVVVREGRFIMSANTNKLCKEISFFVGEEWKEKHLKEKLK